MGETVYFFWREENFIKKNIRVIKRFFLWYFDIIISTIACEIYYIHWILILLCSTYHRIYGIFFSSFNLIYKHFVLPICLVFDAFFLFLQYITTPTQFLLINLYFEIIWWKMRKKIQHYRWTWTYNLNLPNGCCHSF